MIRFVAGLLMVFVGIGTMEQDEVAVVVSNYSAGLWLCIVGLLVMFWGVLGIADKNSGYFYDEDNRQ